MKKINYIPFEHTDRLLKEEYRKAFDLFLEDKWYILGKEVEKFEQAWAKYCETKFSVGVGNGYDALLLCLKALGIENGDKVIVPAHTFAATALAVLNAGAKPALVDAHPETFNIDEHKISEKITEKTKAVLVVHLYGNPCNMDAIVDLVRENDLKLIEDNAQAHGAKYDGKRTGSFGDMAAASFYPVKNLGALGDGGAVNTSNEDLYQKLKLLRSYGSPDKHIFELAGVNSRLDELQAAFLNIKLKYLDKWNRERRRLAALYYEGLKDIGDIRLAVQLEKAEPVFHIFPVLTGHRDKLRSYLLENGIQTLRHYPLPYHLESAFKHLGYKEGSFPIAEDICKKELSLPLFPGLKPEDVDYVCEIVKQFFKHE